MRVVALLALAIGCKGEPTPATTVVCTQGFADRDGDGFGNPALATTDCVEPVVDNDADCDDLDFFTNPDVDELCDGIDNDCNELVDFEDPDVVGAGVYFVDDDGDGFGTGTGTPSCTAISGSALADGDCNDADPHIHPDALEICDDGVDNNCNDVADSEDPTLDTALTFFVDTDGDGFGTDDVVVACAQPPATATMNGDCDDTSASTYPGAVEICDNADQDCDGDPDYPQFGFDVCGDLEGAFEGVYEVVLEHGTEVVTCTGEATLTLDRAQATPVMGTLECTLDGVAEDWAIVQTGTITGQFRADGYMFGELTAFEGAVYPWIGTVVEATSADGSGDAQFVTTVPWEITYGFTLEAE